MKVMQIDWTVNSDDIRIIKSFVDQLKSNPFVQDREKRNLEGNGFKITKENIWRVLVGCLLTTQQRSGPESNVSSLLQTNPFLLSYKTCLSEHDVERYCFKTLSDFGGIRRTNRIAKEIKMNLTSLEKGLWTDLLDRLKQFDKNTSPNLERKTADFIDQRLLGFGPKQSRNFLQWLGLTRYEIPIDSRITKWLNKFGFPVVLSAGALGDRNYYEFVSDGIQQLCAASDIYPCMLDAAIFASFDGDSWTTDNVGY
jgi:hypothetical protein